MTSSHDADDVARFPGRAGIDAYGNGGFRFADMSHAGSLLVLPSGIYAWPVTSFATLELSDFARAFAETDAIEFLLFGTGERQQFPGPAIRAAFDEAGIGLEVMDTGAAARTYNVLLGEARPVAAALIAIP